MSVLEGITTRKNKVLLLLYRLSLNHESGPRKGTAPKTYILDAAYDRTKFWKAVRCQ